MCQMKNYYFVYIDRQVFIFPLGYTVRYLLGNRPVVTVQLIMQPLSWCVERLWLRSVPLLASEAPLCHGNNYVYHISEEVGLLS
jgi:hypothetical protein